MSKYPFALLLSLSLGIYSCQEPNQKPAVEPPPPSPNTQTQAVINPQALSAEFLPWWTYHNKYISLHANFEGLDEQRQGLNKKQFLEKLVSGNYRVLKLSSDAEERRYQLYPLDSLDDTNIGKTIRNEARTSLHHYELEGQPFPDFQFTDLKGRQYSLDQSRGKTIIIKTWFINCHACVAEFQALNTLHAKLEDRKDLIFLSLATDSQAKLESFLQKQNFAYPVIPAQQAFIEELKLFIYPTHLIIDENGIIRKVVNKASEMIAFLEEESIISR